MRHSNQTTQHSDNVGRDTSQTTDFQKPKTRSNKSKRRGQDSGNQEGGIHAIYDYRQWGGKQKVRSARVREVPVSLSHIDLSRYETDSIQDPEQELIEREQNDLKLEAINSALSELTKTESDVVLRVARGESYQIIANEWLVSKGFISKTVKKFRLQVTVLLNQLNE